MENTFYRRYTSIRWKKLYVRTKKRQKNRKRKSKKETCTKDYLLNKWTVFFRLWVVFASDEYTDASHFSHSLSLSLSTFLFLSQLYREQNEIDCYFPSLMRYYCYYHYYYYYYQHCTKLAIIIKKSIVVTRLLAVFWRKKETHDEIHTRHSRQKRRKFVATTAYKKKKK